MLYFITGNKNKLEEARAILGDVTEVQQLDIDLPEIQEMDAHEIIKQKLREAFEHVDGEFIVEDVSFEMEALNGFPGPLVKWFLNTIGTQAMYETAENFGNLKATAKAMIGYTKSPGDIYFFEGVVEGTLAPRVEENGFGFDKIFIPEGYKKRFSQMTPEEKNKISHRRLALNKLRKFLEENPAK